MTPLEWLVPWEPSAAVMLVFAAAAVLFLRGAAREGAGRCRAFSFWSGFALMYAAVQTQFDYYAEHAFFIHRIQHLALHHLGPFLIALARPGPVLAAGMPARWRRPWPKSLLRAAGFLNGPAVAALLFSGLILFWLVPRIHTVAMLDWRLYRLMNWGMAVNGLMFWSAALSPARPAFPRVLMLLAVIPPQIAAGALLFLAPRDLYPVYALCGRAFAGLGALADQQAGGLVLWAGGAMMSVAAVLVVISSRASSPETSFPPAARACALRRGA